MKPGMLHAVVAASAETAAGPGLAARLGPAGAAGQPVIFYRPVAAQPNWRGNALRATRRAAA